MSKLHVEELEARQLFSGNGFFTPSFGLASTLGEQHFQAARSRDEVGDASQIIQTGRDLWMDGNGQVRLHGMIGPDGTDLHMANARARVVDAAFAGLEPTNLASLLPFDHAASPNAMRGAQPFTSESAFAATASTLNLGNPAGRSGSALREPARPGANVVAPSRLDESGEQPHEGARPRLRDLSSPIISPDLRALAAAMRGLVDGLEKISPCLDPISNAIRWYVWIATGALALAAAESGRRLLKRSNAGPALQFCNLPPVPPQRTRP